MATINGLYIHVVRESASREVQATSHPVEDGLPLTDTVKAKALSIKLSGKIVDYDAMQASQVIAKLESWHESGALVTFSGRNVASNMQIRSFDTDHPNTISGGADFSMTLEQVRIAKSAYVPKTDSTKEQEDAAKKDVVLAVGATVVFTGGSVYVSSDAAKAAATRSRSTCKVTQISTASYSVHPVHLISTDGGNVYGWVDKANIEGVQATSTSGTTNAGTQQISKGTSSAVYHTVKSGDTVWALVTQKYAYLNKSVSWVIDNNPNAFSKRGDATTLQIGASLLMGYR